MYMLFFSMRSFQFDSNILDQWRPLVDLKHCYVFECTSVWEMSQGFVLEHPDQEGKCFDLQVSQLYNYELWVVT